MNFLAHSLLSGPKPEDLIGNLAADFLTYDTIETLPDRLRPGVEKHWRIDVFTDEHPVVLRSKQRLKVRRVSGIVIDITYDHFLARNWEQYHSQTLREFIDQTYATLATHAEWCPPVMQTRIPRMIREDWMFSYREEDGLKIALERVSRRMKSGVLMSGAFDKVLEHYNALESDFLEFFPQARAKFSIHP